MFIRENTEGEYSSLEYGVCVIVNIVNYLWLSLTLHLPPTSCQLLIAQTLFQCFIVLYTVLHVCVPMTHLHFILFLGAGS